MVRHVPMFGLSNCSEGLAVYRGGGAIRRLVVVGRSALSRVKRSGMGFKNRTAVSFKAGSYRPSGSLEGTLCSHG